MSGNGVHSEYPPSALKRLTNCSRSKHLSDSVPEPVPYVYALQGSAAHLLGSRCLEIGIDATDKIGSSLEYVETRIWTEKDIELYRNAHMPVPNYALKEQYVFAAWYGKVDEDMALAVQVYLNEIRRKKKLLKHPIQYIEHQFDLSWIIKGMFGTADSVLVEPFDVIFVDDYKHGAGFAVDIEDNEQLMAYGLGALGRTNLNRVSKIVLTIIQPRAMHAGGPIRSWEISTKDLIAWGMDVLRPALIRTNDPDAPFKAGSWCKWCAGKPVCPEIIKEMFDNSLVPSVRSTTLPVIDRMTSEELDRYLQFSEVLEIWIGSLKDEAYKRLELALPNAPKTKKLVKGKGSRQWRNEEYIIQFAQKQIGENAFSVATLKSPAQMEKAFELAKLNPRDLSLFIKKTEGKPSMVSVDQPGPALPSKIEQMFGKGD